MPESGNNNASMMRPLILKARPGVTTILRRPATSSKPKEKDSLMRPEQPVNEVAQVVLWRQARALAQQTVEPLLEALEAVLKTPTLRHLEKFRINPHQDDE